MIINSFNQRWLNSAIYGGLVIRIGFRVKGSSYEELNEVPKSVPGCHLAAINPIKFSLKCNDFAKIYILA